VVLESGSGLVYGCKGRGVREYRIEVFDWIIIDWKGSLLGSGLSEVKLKLGMLKLTGI
jgi:hypothetical protein